MPPDTRSLLLVAGSGRSGTSLLAGLAGRLGFQIPVPEVNANASNPRGFGEPRWAVDFHNELLKSVNVSAEDGRPEAWVGTAKVATRPRPQQRLASWLDEQFTSSDRVVVKDPRLAWFLDLYLEVAPQVSVDISVITMLRHPAESIRSRELAYGSGSNATTRTAGWLNMMLGTELHTRNLPRAIVRYDDLLKDWRSALAEAERGLPFGLVSTASDSQLDEAADLVDASLRRAAPDWSELGLPLDVQELAEATHLALGAMAGRVAEPGSTLALDELRDRYARVYENAESLASSSLRAARVEERRRVARQVEAARDETTTGKRSTLGQKLSRVLSRGGAHGN